VGYDHECRWRPNRSFSCIPAHQPPPSANLMVVFELVIGLLFVGALLSIVARRANMP